MEPTDTGKADYFHKVVDCQWACPAHTDVPEYIRLIAQGRVHRGLPGEPRLQRLPRHSRPRLRPALRAGLPPRPHRGKAGRDLPAEAGGRRPARRHHARCCPSAPQQKNGKRIACIGAGPPRSRSRTICCPWATRSRSSSSSTVAGGLMRTNIPAFRLPAKVLDEEIGYIVDMGAKLELNTPVDSMRQTARLRGIRCRVRRHRRAEGQGARAARAATTATACTSASPGSSRWRSSTSTRSASGC